MKSRFLCAFCFGAITLATAQDVDEGIAQFRKNNFAEAAAILRKAVQSDEGNARANLYLGLTLIEQNKADEAEPFITKANEIAPSGETKAGKARLYVAKREYENAENALQEADGEDVPYVRGLLELGQKKYAEATRDLEAYIESHPDHAYAHYYAGLACNGMKRPDKMLTHFQIFLKMKPDAPEARKVQAVVSTGR